MILQVELRVFGAAIDHLNFVEGLEHLSTLVVHESKIKSVDPLASLAKLRTLSLTSVNLNGHSISLIPLSGLALLETVDFTESSAIVDVAPLASCTGLRKLSLKGTRATNVLPLQTIDELVIDS